MITIDHVLLAGCGIALALLWARSETWRIFGIAVASLIILFVRWPRFTIFEIGVGWIGSLSISSVMAILALVVSNLGGPGPRRDEKTFAFGTVVAIGCALYVSAFGFTMLDIYATGFGWTVPFSLSIILITWSAYRGWIWLPMTVAAVTVAHRLAILPSANWFDYALDPILFLLAATYLLTARISLICKPGRKPSSLPAEWVERAPRDRSQ